MFIYYEKKNKRKSFSLIIQDVDNRRSQLVNQHLRDKSEEYDAEGPSKAKIRHSELDTKQHEDHIRHFEVRNQF
jgi:hypothetical protein